MTSSYNYKRNALRYNINENIIYSDYSGNINNGIIINISKSGALLQSYNEIYKKDKLILEFNFDSDKYYVNCLVVYVYTKYYSAKVYFGGIKFCHTDKSKDFIKIFIKHYDDKKKCF